MPEKIKDPIRLKVEMVEIFSRILILNNKNDFKKSKDIISFNQR